MRDEIDFSSDQRVTTSPDLAALTATIALEHDVRCWFLERAGQSGDAGLGALINAALREHIRRAGEPLERTLRRVLREELRKAG